MPFPWILIALLLAGDSAGVEPEHERNSFYTGLLRSGWSLGGQSIPFASPRFIDDQDPGSEAQALRMVAGSDAAVRDLTRKSVTAPFILKVRDIKVEEGTVRVADLWFVVHTELATIRLDEASSLPAGEPVEAGNMRFEARLLDGADLAGREPTPEETRQWLVHLQGTLLDRIAVETTNRTVATRSSRSIVVASQTDRSFDRDRDNPNAWASIDRREGKGPARTYGGSASYVKISQLRSIPDALMVEGHFAFFEPKDWFDGAPILRSKISLIAQDQIRRLRREIQRREP